MQTIPSFADSAKIIVAHVAPKLKAAGFRKRAHSFNRRLENGLIHHFSARLLSATSSMHGRFMFEAGCYVPEERLYNPREEDPKWIPIYHCCVQEHFVNRTNGRYDYLDVKSYAREPSHCSKFVDQCLNALEKVSHYDQLMAEEPDVEPFAFSTPKGIVQCCIAFGQGDTAKARNILSRYLAECEQREEPPVGHISVVREWGAEHDLLQ